MMPKAKDTLQTPEVREQLTEAQPDEATADLTKGLKPLADKPALEEVEDPTVRERREVSAQVRGGDEARQKTPNEDTAIDERSSAEVAQDQADNADLPVGPDVTLDEDTPDANGDELPVGPDITLDYDYAAREAKTKADQDFESMWRSVPEKERPKR